MLEKFKKDAENFFDHLPYLDKPYSSRNWGHPWHSLCSYHGKLKPAIAHFLIERFTNKGDIILDPMCGVGTIPFEACLQGRIGIGNDLSEMAYVVTKSKLEIPNKEDVNRVIRNLETFIEDNKTQFVDDNLPYKDFGFNGNIPEYFHIDTYKELLAARQYFIGRIDNLTNSESMVLACLLHVLHGNRPYALSRNSHPLTPYAPKGEFIYKNVVEHIKAKVESSFKKASWENYLEGRTYHQDLFTLNSSESIQTETIDAIITSPPFLSSLRFYISNWMRLWLVGWEPINFSDADRIFLEGKQKRDLDIYNDFFELCYQVLKPQGKLILHLGKSKKYDMALELSNRAKGYFDIAFIGNESVENIEKHGITDKGSTTDHQFLFLMKK